MNEIIKEIYIVGSKGIPAKYGGFETFVENLISNKKDNKIKYYVSCMGSDNSEFEYKDATCFNIKLPFNNAFGRLLYVSKALNYIEKKSNNKKIIYILGCRIGPLLIFHKKKLVKRNSIIFSNPDGLEWKRNKWNKVEKDIIKICEKCLVLNSDLCICDSKAIEEYINRKYPKTKTTYIAYGSETKQSSVDNKLFDDWLNEKGIEINNYYLTVGRFVPENNYEIIIKEYMKSNSNRKLVIITNYDNDYYYNYLLKETEFNKDKRIVFAGTIYDKELLFKIRENAYGYIHGHEVGGTNPSLLEALAHTKINLLYDVPYNKEVALDTALYWSKENDSLKNTINKVELLDNSAINELSLKAKNRINSNYNWDKICLSYEKVFSEYL